MAGKSTNWLAELGRRGVFQAVGIYVAVAWGSIEILITASERFGWPAWVGDAALILFLTALPFVVLLSWAFDLTGSGLQRMEFGSLRGKAVIATTATVVLGLSASWFLLRDAAPGGDSARSRDADPRPVIAIMPFVDQSGHDQGELLALVFTDEVINRINAHPDLVALDLQTVTSPLMAGFVQAASEPPMDYTVRGFLRSAPKGVELRIRMTDADGRVAWDHDTVIDVNDAVALREEQKFVAGQVAAGVGESLTGTNYCEPSANSEALELFYEARRRFVARGGENVATAAKMLERAIELDPLYAQAKDLLASVYLRFPAYVRANPSWYGMSEAELIEFIGSRPALPLAREAVALCPTLASSYVTVETHMAAAQTWADGAEIILEALRRQPGNLDLRGQLFEIYIMMGHLEAAQKVVDEMVRRDPLEPRNSYLAGTVARLKGEFQQAYDLTEQAISRGFSQFMGEAHLACDLMYLDEAAALDELLGPDWAPNNAFPVDPRRDLASHSDPALRQAVAAEFEALVDEGDRTVMRNLVGYSCSVLFEFGDVDLTRRAAQRLADVMGRGEMVPIFWQARHRGDWGSRVLDIEIWQEHWIDFWERIGPPDGCTWDGEQLACEWERTFAAIQTTG